nr:IS110 family transposase [Enterocloster clostridioformis]
MSGTSSPQPKNCDRINVTIANPKWVKAVKGNKDDTKDSKWIGDLFRLGLVPGSFIPCKDIRILREYTRYRFKLTCCKRSEKNRFQNAFTVCNVALDAVVTDMFGKSASAITDYLITSDEFDPDTCKSFLQKSLKKKANAVVEPIEGYQMTPSQKERMLMVRSHLAFVQQSIDSLDSKLDELVAPYENAISLLCTIPGIDRASAITIISEIGTDMTQFNSSERLCCWAGLTPGNNESAGKKKSVRITRAGVYLKPALVQCVHAAVKSTTTPYYKNKCERIAKRRGKKRAKIAIARMLLTAVYQMLSTGETWNHCKDDLTVFYGHDYAAMEGLLAGADGWLSGFPAVLPKQCRRLQDACFAKEVDAAIAAQNNIQPYIDYFFYDKVNGVPHWQEICKYTLQAQGLDVGLPRKPLGELDDANKKKIEKLLADME